VHLRGLSLGAMIALRSWREVGEAIGTSGEAARQRYSASA